MHVEAVELRRVALPMVRPFRAAHGTVSVRELVLVRLAGPDGDGWGECAALAEPTYTGEFVAGAWLVLRDHLAPRLLAADDVDARTLPDVVGDVVGHPMATAALELALLDAEGQRRAAPLTELLDPTAAWRPTVPAGAAIGLQPGLDDLVELVEARVEEGYRRLKVKIAPGRDVEVLRAARRTAGPDVDLVADANGAYRLDAVDPLADAGRLAALDELDLACLEQPLAADDLAGHAELARRLATPVCLDESLTSRRLTLEALERGACSVVCVKAPRYGSWLEAAAVLDDCAAAGAGAWIGGMLDGAVGRAATLALAAHPAVTLTGDTSPSSATFTDDVAASAELRRADDGAGLVVPAGPGLGARPEVEALDRLTVERVELRR